MSSVYRGVAILKDLSFKTKQSFQCSFTPITKCLQGDANPNELSSFPSRNSLSSWKRKHRCKYSESLMFQKWAWNWNNSACLLQCHLLNLVPQEQWRWASCEPTQTCECLSNSDSQQRHSHWKIFSWPTLCWMFCNFVRNGRKVSVIESNRKKCKSRITNNASFASSLLSPSFLKMTSKSCTFFTQPVRTNSNSLFLFRFTF